MTEKRFVSEDNCCGYYTEIIDNEKELDLSLPNPKKNLIIEELIDLLNSLNNENEQLKQQMQRLYNYFADWFDGRVPPSNFSEMWDFVKEDEKWG